MLILISDAFDDKLPKLLGKFGEVTDDKSRLPEATVVLVRSATKCTKEWIDSAANLKLIIRGGVGMDNIDREYAHSIGVKTMNTAAASAIAVAELAMALMLAATSHVVSGHLGMAHGQWLKKQLKRTELYGKTLGLIGMGNIATEVAKRAKAFGMEIVVYRKSGKPADYGQVVSFDELLKKSDLISLHVPLVKETENLINAQTMDKMKDDVIIINTGRGRCVNVDDMAQALNDGKVKVFATDVYYSDPPPQDSPILTAPNTIMTPHIGAGTKENMGRVGQVAAGIIEDFIKEQ